MEAASLAIGAVSVAGLVRVGVDVLNSVESYKNVAADSRLLRTRFDINKAIFREWAKGVGIISCHALSEAQHHPLLDDADISSVVHRTLLCIRDIFGETEASRNNIDMLLLKLDCDVPPLPSAEHKPSSSLTKLCGVDKQQNPKKKHSAFNLSTRKAKLAWSWGGKNRFTVQVEAFEALLKRLRTLVPPNRSEDLEKHLDGKMICPFRASPQA
jgi:hypothetical protein